MICNICYREALEAGQSTASVTSCTVCHRRSCRHAVMDAEGRCGRCAAAAAYEDSSHGDEFEFNMGTR